MFITNIFLLSCLYLASVNAAGYGLASTDPSYYHSGTSNNLIGGSYGSRPLKTYLTGTGGYNYNRPGYYPNNYYPNSGGYPGSGYYPNNGYYPTPSGGGYYPGNGGYYPGGSGGYYPGNNGYYPGGNNNGYYPGNGGYYPGSGGSYPGGGYYPGGGAGGYYPGGASGYPDRRYPTRGYPSLGYPPANVRDTSDYYDTYSRSASNPVPSKSGYSKRNDESAVVTTVGKQ